MSGLSLLSAAGGLRDVDVVPAPGFVKPTGPLRSRVAYAAAHVVPLPWADNTPGSPAEIDWDATLAYRHHLWSWGLGVADAMDTAQRNMGLDAAATRELIVRSSREASSVGGAIVVGVNTDQVDDETISLARIIDAYSEQLQVAEDAGAVAVLMASRHLARAAASAEDSPADVYRHVYREVLKRASAPVVLHWLGEAFDPVLSGYFGSRDWHEASATVIDIIEENADKVSGIKMSLLDAESEISVRARLPLTARMFTGDDFNYVGLIAGDGERYSNALLGAFTAIGPHASAAIQALDAGDTAEYQRILAPTEALSRQIFAAPTYYYKTGIAFLSWLNGHQAAFSMVGGLHSARSLPHLSEIVRLANECGALEQPELAAARWHSLLELNGIESGVAR
jgi:hypothetical protein